MTQTTYEFTVREATKADWPGVVEALTDAFTNDPVMVKAVGGKGKEHRVRALFDFQIRTTYGRKGTIDIAVTDDGKVLGAAMWLSPQAQKGGLLSDIISLPNYCKVLGSGIFQAATTELKLLAARPNFDHWYLYTIGVHGDARSHGIGSKLLDYRRTKLGNYPAYLEASTYRSASLYARHGFVELFPFKDGKPALGMLHPAPESRVALTS